jgi:thiol:disulfide interchange protein
VKFLQEAGMMTRRQICCFWLALFLAGMLLVSPAAEVMETNLVCDQNKCYLPASGKSHGSSEIATAQGLIPASAQDNSPKAGVQGALKNKYMVAAFDSGYMDAGQFLAFLDLSSTGRIGGIDAFRARLQSGARLLSILLIILGGLALNLTPCVLPLLPVNLAVIGAGTKARNMKSGFVNGAVYGLGIVLAYGLLGTLTVRTGAQFGAINAAPWFNLAIALIFLVLALALFDLFIIDFTKFQSRVLISGKGLFPILLLGAVSAVLAGACVAPVVIAVLLFSTDLYLKGQNIGLVLPFLLGLGMALPWPFAGAGLAFLPKPGKWMVRVKYIFAVVILLAAFYYGALGIKLLHAEKQTVGGTAVSGHGWFSFSDPASILETKDAQNKPVLIYFGASWCKSCKLMETTTFRDKAVRKRLDDFIRVKYAAENPRDPAVAQVLRDFGVLGLPSYVIMKQK